MARMSEGMRSAAWEKCLKTIAADMTYALQNRTQNSSGTVGGMAYHMWEFDAIPGWAETGR